MTTTKENNLIQINKETRIVDSKKNNIFAFGNQIVKCLPI